MPSARREQRGGRPTSAKAAKNRPNTLVVNNGRGIQQELPYNRAFDDGSEDQHSAYRREFAGRLMSDGMSNNAESSKFKIGELVRMIGTDEVGEVVSLGERGLFVRYNHDSETVTFFPEKLVERVPSTLDF